MYLQAPRGPELFKRGFTLIEISATLAILAVVLGIILGSYQARINKARLDQTVDEMMTLGKAAVDFYQSQGSWPAHPSDLVPSYMYANLASSPFGQPYQINGLNMLATISTAVPTGMAQYYYQGSLLEIVPGVPNDTIIISQSLPNAFSGRLEYDKKYNYHQ